jgi:peptidoglycan/xylan/chitin deacetylase (PgdA/CDA1 family)
MRAATRAIRRALFAAGRSKVFWPLLRSRATIFMLHRFRATEMGVEGLDPETLRRSLAALRRQRFEILPLTTLLEGLASGRNHKTPPIAFTIDDGYLDHANVAAPVFAEFDCPVTTFVTTGFLDKQLWFWWDRIEYVFENTALHSVTVPFGGQPATWFWSDAFERAVAQQSFIARCKEVSDTEKGDAVNLLAHAAQVEIPERPPLRYAPMTWADLRRCEKMTMSFGPHTVTHPILSRTTDAQARFELTESWNRLQAEAASPVPIGCYPNGRSGDFGPREIGILGELGFAGAVTGMVGYADAPAIQSGDMGRFYVRRFAYPDSVDEVLLVAGGAERFKQIVRRES